MENAFSATVSCLHGDSETWMRQNIIKTHSAPVGNRCVRKSHYVGLDGKAWIGCTRDRNKQTHPFHPRMKSQRQKPLHGGMETPCWLQLRNKVICYFPDLREDVFILYHQRVGVHVFWKQVLSVAFCASLGSALDILRPWREAKGNQSQVNYSHLPSWCTLHSPELHFRVHKLKLLGPEAALNWRDNRP